MKQQKDIGRMAILYLDDQPKLYSKIPMLVTFIEDTIEVKKTGGVRIGGLEGRFTVPDDL